MIGETVNTRYYNVSCLNRLDLSLELNLQNAVYHFKEITVLLANRRPAVSFIARFSYSLCKIIVDVKQSQPEILLYLMTSTGALGETATLKLYLRKNGPNLF